MGQTCQAADREGWQGHALILFPVHGNGCFPLTFQNTFAQGVTHRGNNRCQDQAITFPSTSLQALPQNSIPLPWPKSKSLGKLVKFTGFKSPRHTIACQQYGVCLRIPSLIEALYRTESSQLP